MNVYYIHVIIKIISFVFLANLIFTKIELSKLLREKPVVLQNAGIIEIDWWFRCVRGVFRLGFLGAGEELDGLARLSFKLFIFGYLWFISLTILLAMGVEVV